MGPLANIGYLDTQADTVCVSAVFSHIEPEIILPRLARLAQQYGGAQVGRIIAGMEPVPGASKAATGWYWIDPETKDGLEYSNAEIRQLFGDSVDAELTAFFPFHPGFGCAIPAQAEDTRVEMSLTEVPEDMGLEWNSESSLFCVFDCHGDLWVYQPVGNDECIADGCRALFHTGNMADLAAGDAELLARL